MSSKQPTSLDTPSHGQISLQIQVRLQEAKMWVDTVIGVPTIGLQISPSFATAFKYAERLQPMLDDEIARSKELEFGGDLQRIGLQFRTKRGFTYKLLVDNIVVEFAYIPKQSRPAGRLPTSEMPPLEKYSALADETANQMVRVLRLLYGADQPKGSDHAKVIRFGMVADVRMEKSKAPPGIADMIQQHGSFFRGELIKAEANFLVNLERAADHIDRCHHVYVFDDSERPDDLSVKLDWQRVFNQPLHLSSPAEQLRQMKESALGYFEQAGRGGLKDA